MRPGRLLHHLIAQPDDVSAESLDTDQPEADGPLRRGKVRGNEDGARRRAAYEAWADDETYLINQSGAEQDTVEGTTTVSSDHSHAIPAVQLLQRQRLGRGWPLRQCVIIGP